MRFYELMIPETQISLFVYVIAWEGVKFGINFMTCSKNGNEISQGVAECYFAVIATTNGIYPKISLLPVLSIPLSQNI